MAVRPVRHFRRYRQVTDVLLRHGFALALERFGLRHHPFGRILPGREAPSATAWPEGLALHLRLALEELGPTFVKLGQILSTRPDLLPPAYIAELSRLQDAVPPAPWDEIRQVLSEELGQPPEQVFATIDPQPLAAASLAQVHAATLPGGEEVVVKVQRPHIRATIAVDLEILSYLAKRAQATRWGQIYDFVEITDDFASTLQGELDYRREGRNADRFRASFAHEPYLYVPHVYWELGSGRVLVLERIRGIKIDDIAALDAAGYDRHRVALHSARIIIKEVLEDGFFHADPHPGNFVVMPGEVIGAMDFGMVGYLSRNDRLNLIRLYTVAIQLDAEGIVEELLRLGAASVQVDRQALGRDISRLLTKYHGLPLKDIRAREVVEEVMPIAFRHHLRLPSNLWLLGKTLIMMEGVGLQLDPDFDIFAVSERYGPRLLRHLVWPDDCRQALLRQGVQWGELIGALPRVGSRLLEQAERGEIFQLQLKGHDQISHGLDRLGGKLALSLLVAALTIGSAILLSLGANDGSGRWLALGGLVGAAGLGGWLLHSIRQAGL